MDRKLQGFAVLVLTLFCSGCGGSQRGYITHDEELVPVEGQVLFEGKPAKNATIVFHREGVPTIVEPGKSPIDRPLNPRGDCDEEGRFQIYTYAVDDGAPVGNYRVTVSWRDPDGQAREQTTPELLPHRYQDPGNSGLVANVTEDGTNILPPFNLKR